MSTRHVIIGGANKAGTTSLYRYLADHPAVCTSFVKQSFYFLDEELQRGLSRTSLYPYSASPGSYERFFTACGPGDVLLDASPEYLYSPGTPARIHSYFDDDVKLVFLLRNPVDRLLSLYRFGQQQGLLPSDMSLVSFIDRSSDYRGSGNPSLRALESGHYSRYLTRYYDVFDDRSIIIVFFEDLVRCPAHVLDSLARQLGIAGEFYDDYEFNTYNATVSTRSQRVRNGYLRIREIGLRLSAASVALRPLTGTVHKVLSKLYRSLNTVERSRFRMDVDLRREIELRYEGEADRIATLIGRRPPW